MNEFNNVPELPEELESLFRQEAERRKAISDSIDHFYDPNYVSSKNISLEVLQIGWDKGNDITPIVLISKAIRQELGVELGQIVKVEHNNKTIPCIVERQFRALKHGVTVNKIVAHVLGLHAQNATVNDTPDDDGQVLGSVVNGSRIVIHSLA
jgi:hypothetical protein